MKLRHFHTMTALCLWFFVGELTQSFGYDARSFKFRHAPWLKVLLDNDPLLLDQDVRFLRSGVPATDLVEYIPSYRRERMKLEHDPLYMADGHDVFIVGYGEEYMYPKNSPISYRVFCTRGGLIRGI
ncbi:MAG: hypothetical protein KC448_02545 [Yoonia sp.]|nr:hypothetical protein [Yoonia sp.]